MDLEAPLRTLGSPLEAEVLRVLAGADTDFTAPQVNRIAGSGSPFGVRKALTRLAEAGLASTSQVGSTQTWRANRQHLLWPAVDLALGARRRLLDLIQHEVRRSEGVNAYLFGSLARRESSPESDVDVLLVFPDSYDAERVADIGGQLSDDITAWTGNPAQTFSVTRSELRTLVSEGAPIIESFRSDAVALEGPEFAVLLGELDRGGDE